MTTIAVYTMLLILLTPPLGAWMHRVYTRERIGRAEGLVYRLIGVNAEAEQTWKRYAASVLWFSLAGTLFVYVIFRLQRFLPLNPQKLPSVNPFVSFNTATSFATNTDWQVYGGETTMSYLSQMLALTFQNFVSAAVGMAVMIAMVRGFTRQRTASIGNFWRDLVRGTLSILLPMSVVMTLVLVSQGVVQTLGHSVSAHGVQGFDQTIARGPAASHVAIKQIGTDGGGFFNVNSAHPFENPTPFSNFVEMFSILWIAAGLTYTFGKMVGSARQGWALFAAMWILMVAGIALTVPAER
ncbi:MAG TPA: potassium-transporting ATPase subunit KdpA, partial [Actinomycetota bacterium]